MKNDKNGFTFIEMLAVISIIVILAAMIISAVGSAVEKTKRASCARNMAMIIKALHLYIEDYDSSSKIASGGSYSDALELYGTLYYPQTKGRMGGITSLSMFVCPSTNHKPPPAPPGGYGHPFVVDATHANKGCYKPGFSGSSIDYWLIKAHSGGSYNNPVLTDYPDSNAILWEVSSFAEGFHHPGGRNIGYWDGTVKFFPVDLTSSPPDDPAKYPKNIGEDGSLESLTIKEADRYVYVP